MVNNCFDVRPGGGECRKVSTPVINRCSGRIAIQRDLHCNLAALSRAVRGKEHLSDQRGAAYSYMKRFLLFLLLVTTCPPARAQFLDAAFGHPYLQNTTSHSVTLVWWTRTDAPGTISFGNNDIKTSQQSQPQRIVLTKPESGGSEPRFRHAVRLQPLQPGSQYHYRVEQGTAVFDATFRTAPATTLTPIRFLVWADTETEPASHGHLGAGVPEGYPMDQNDGIRACVAAAAEIEADFILLAGDVTECGGELEDWDEFFRKVNDRANLLAAHTPIFAVPGNHDYYAGPHGGGYEQPGSERHAMHKFHSHFELPTDERYYQFTWGPATIIGLDSCNQSPNESELDTNFALTGEKEPGGGRAPNLTPESQQYRWLKTTLAAAQKRSPFIFVFFHHMPFGSGVHSLPPGRGDGQDWQSGYPLRRLDPLFHHYGVDAVFCGHEEMVEIAETHGVTAKGAAHKIRYFTPGSAGDGMRSARIDNDAQVFHYGNTAIGQHYGFLDITIGPASGQARIWRATIRQAWIDPSWAKAPAVPPLGGYYDAEVPTARYEIEKAAP